MATIDLGKVAFVWKGTYNSGTTYEEKDVVQYTDSGELSSYVYVNASSASGQTPSTGGTVNTTYWSKMAGGTSLSVGNNKVVTTDASGNVSSVALGTAGQGLKVNSGGTGLEFGQLGTVKQIVSGVYKVGNTSSTSNHGNWINVDGTITSITPTSTSAKILGLVTGIKGHSNGTNQGSLYTIFRDINGGGYSNLHADGNAFAESCFQESSGNNRGVTVGFNFLDEPNTTSQVNYKHFYKSLNNTGGTTYYYSHAGYSGSGDAYIRTILMEF